MTYNHEAVLDSQHCEKDDLFCHHVVCHEAFHTRITEPARELVVLSKY